MLKNYKVGDRVKILDNPLGIISPNFIGKIGTIICIYGRQGAAEIECNGTSFGYYWNQFLVLNNGSYVITEVKT